MLSGVAGEIAFHGARADVAPVKTMTKALRNTDDQDSAPWHSGWAALGQVPLAAEITSEPTVDAERALAVVFSGRLFNRDELHAELVTGYRFRTATDAELLLAAYDRWGAAFVEHLDGDFAIVLVDQRRDRVLLIRDRLGIQPLYLARMGERLRFASTLPALVASGGISTAIDHTALHHYMSWHSIVPAPRTIVAGVTKLPPATMQIIEADGRISQRTYWQPDYARSSAHADWNSNDWHDAIHQALQAAVERSQVPDQPLGVLLSGGLDSSLLVAMLAKSGRTNIPTFSIGFEDTTEPDGNEFVYSDKIAEVFNTDHHTLRLGASDLAPALDDAIGAMTEPMASHDVPAFYLHSQHVAKQLHVVQCGQGADEIFAGYGYHGAAAAVPRDAALATFTDAFADRDQHGLAEVLNPNWLPATNVSHELLAQYIDAPGAETAIDAVLRLETQLFMADDPVKRVTNMGMAAGLEACLPFLDHEFVELVVACPPELKTDQGGKGILKNIGRRLLPSEVIDRPKGYFPVPALRHLEDPILSNVSDALTAPEARERGLFRADYIDSLLAQPNEHYVPTGGNTLWQVGLLEMWLQRHGIG